MQTFNLNTVIDTLVLSGKYFFRQNVLNPTVDQSTFHNTMLLVENGGTFI